VEFASTECGLAGGAGSSGDVTKWLVLQTFEDTYDAVAESMSDLEKLLSPQPKAPVRGLHLNLPSIPDILQHTTKITTHPARQRQEQEALVPTHQCAVFTAIRCVTQRPERPRRILQHTTHRRDYDTSNKAPQTLPRIPLTTLLHRIPAYVKMSVD
jgi:hypothetical protein